MSRSGEATAYRFDDAGRLLAAACTVCGQVDSPPRAFHCDRPTRPTAIDAAGTIESSTLIQVAPERFPVPYAMAYVRLDAGPRVLVRLAGTAVRPAGERVIVEPDPGGAGGLLAHSEPEAGAREMGR